MATKKTAAAVAEKPAPKRGPRGKKNPAQCVFDLFNLRFGMSRAEVVEVVGMVEDDSLAPASVKKAGADTVEAYFDHLDRMWQVKATYTIDNVAEAEALLDRMSKDYRFQTPSSRVAFEITEMEGGKKSFGIRYTEINLKRVYIHHMMALGAAAKAEEEQRQLAKTVAEMEDEEYIPTGPLIF